MKKLQLLLAKNDYQFNSNYAVISNWLQSTQNPKSRVGVHFNQLPHDLIGHNDSKL